VVRKPGESSRGLGELPLSGCGKLQSIKHEGRTSCHSDLPKPVDCQRKKSSPRPHRHSPLWFESHRFTSKALEAISNGMLEEWHMNSHRKQHWIHNVNVIITQTLHGGTDICRSLVICMNEGFWIVQWKDQNSRDYNIKAESASLVQGRHTLMNLWTKDVLTRNFLALSQRTATEWFWVIGNVSLLSRKMV